MNIIKYFTNWKYRFFQKKISDVSKSMLELDFKISKARAMREDSRKQRDGAVETVARIKTMPETEESKKQLEEAEAAVKGFEAQMQLVDDQTNGSEEQAGLMQHLSGLADLKAMYTDYSNQI